MSNKSDAGDDKYLRLIRSITKEDMDTHQAIWNARYEKVLRSERTLVGEPWIENWLHLVPRSTCRRAFDVGCGSGYNTRLLVEQGFEVTAIDVSEPALELCRHEAPRARIEWADVRKGLPFAGEHFELIVADLSLHYFPWDITAMVIREVANRLVPGGLFVGRFNSTSDGNYGAGTGEPVPGEPNLLVVGDIEKRFFTRDCFSRLFGPPWTVLSLKEDSTCRFGSRKMFWEMVATTCDGHSVKQDTAQAGESARAPSPPVS